MTPAHGNCLVTLHIWRVPAVRLPAVLWRMAVDRRRLRRTPTVQFAKLLGTGAARHFGPATADPTRWATLVVWEPGAAANLERTEVGQAWQSLATSVCRLDLAPLASRGTWAGRDPFTDAVMAKPPAGNAMVLALTRARLRPPAAMSFWQAIGDVAGAVRQAPGLLATFGVGEAPIGWQGTVSLWRGVGDLVEFAYRQADHRAAIEQTSTRHWYAEELFARFAVLGVTGDRSVINWTESTDEQDRESL